MKTLACLSLLALAACGGGGDTPDADIDLPDAGEADAANPDADPPDAGWPDASCTSDPACDGAGDGDTRCLGNAVVTCDETAPGCLQATTVPCTDADVCVDDGTPACQANGDGESCAAAQYITADTVISGADIEADYTDDHDFTDGTCEEGSAAASNVEAVFAVNLVAGQGLVVTESGGVDAILGIQRACGDAEACLAATDEPESLSVVADQPTTLFIYVGAYFDGLTTADYSISFDFTQCGDGVVEGAEECDDDDADGGDGCSASCDVEFGFTCDTVVEPTVCTALPDLGSYGGGATIAETSASPLAAGASTFYTITFTAPVEVTGTLTATAGDVDLYAYSAQAALYAEAATGDETIGDTLVPYFTPGTYIFEVYAYAALDNGYTLTLDTVAPAHTDLGSFAATDTIADVVDATGLEPGASDYFTITFTGDVSLAGTLDVTSTGDADLYWWVAGNPSFVADAFGNESFTGEPLPAGQYYVRVNAYWNDAAIDGYTLTLTPTAP